MMKNKISFYALVALAALTLAPVGAQTMAFGREIRIPGNNPVAARRAIDAERDIAGQLPVLPWVVSNDPLAEATSRLQMRLAWIARREAGGNYNGEVQKQLVRDAHQYTYEAAGVHPDAVPRFDDWGRQIPQAVPVILPPRPASAPVSASTQAPVTYGSPMMGTTQPPAQPPAEAPPVAAYQAAPQVYPQGQVYGQPQVYQPQYQAPPVWAVPSYPAGYPGGVVYDPGMSPWDVTAYQAVPIWACPPRRPLFGLRLDLSHIFGGGHDRRDDRRDHGGHGRR